MPGCQESHPVTTYIFSLKVQKKTQIGNNTSHANLAFHGIEFPQFPSHHDAGTLQLRPDPAKVPETLCKMAQVSISCYPAGNKSSEAAAGSDFQQHAQVTEYPELGEVHKDQSPAPTHGWSPTPWGY